MKSLENRLSDVRPPDVSVPSHRIGLERALRAAPTPAPVPLHRRPLAVGLATLMLALGGLTLAHPSWARDLVRLILVDERKLVASDGRKVTERTYQVSPDAANLPSDKSVRVQIGANGDVVATDVQPGLTPGREQMAAEAAEQVRRGAAPIYIDRADSKTYRVRLSSGQEILYTVGPGSSWSVSEFTPQNR